MKPFHRDGEIRTAHGLCDGLCQPRLPDLGLQQAKRRQAKSRATNRVRRLASKRPLRSCASESLTEADIDLDRRAVAALAQRGRQVEAQRPEDGVVTQTQAHA